MKQKVLIGMIRIILIATRNLISLWNFSGTINKDNEGCYRKFKRERKQKHMKDD
jgi:hypothetical protein